MSAAPLKLRRALSVRRARCVFPHSDECGPIEAATGRRQGSSSTPSFRTQMSAAPLKLPKGDFHGGCVEVFPHSDECGPIEAIDLAVGACRYVAAFPHSDECGPIEAISCVAATPFKRAVSALR